MSQPRCFVISPIGAPGSDVRAHADDVFDYIIRPAVEELGYAAHRGDHAARPGRISDQMYSSILNDELLIAILTYQNPNVFYELAIAHAAARPLVILCEASHNIPFDIKDQRVIFYDLRPRSLFEGTYKAELKRAVEQLRSGDFVREVPFKPSLSPLGGFGEQFRIFDRFVDVIGGMEHFKLMAQSEKWLDVAGIALQSLGMSSDFLPTLTAIGEKGVKIRILIMDERNPALPAMLNAVMPDHAGKVQEEIRRAFDFWSELAVKMPDLEVRKVQTGIIYQQLFMSEARMLYTPYAISDTTHYSPTIQAASRSPLYVTQGKEFSYLWKSNGPGTRSGKPKRGTG